VGRREEDERFAINPLDALDPQRTEELPGGTRMGSMFHHVFEHIDFQMVMEGPADILADDAARLVIESSLAHYRIAPRWAATVARLVAATLRTPIHVGDPPLVLGQLGVDQRRHEIEFYFPLVAKPPLTIKVPGCNRDSDSCGQNGHPWIRRLAVFMAGPLLHCRLEVQSVGSGI
jgi:exodeoxyribonuclease V beta subunit